ncbi:E3 ubiquitin-protein ligase PUB23-like [Impatiens glandulifera]|uniref:E3 ubiquitin-protein ligase PUB23-like n=1 Tax=Impatiens glandulifera TaxID=253017 RepID=UPI001FB13B35|nr:E3 ubiquitin-protein ligase PUB23-like [Impatiens glandulifera]
MEIMTDPVTISTGISYDRKNIEKWFFTYKKSICPATMQKITSFDITPNHTLKRLILSWPILSPIPSPEKKHPSLLAAAGEISTLLISLESSPFKGTILRKIRSFLDMGFEKVKVEFEDAKGVESLVKIVVQILDVDAGEFLIFRAAEEAIGILYVLSCSGKMGLEKVRDSTDMIKAMAVLLQRGSMDARFHVISIFGDMSKVGGNQDWSFLMFNQCSDLFKSIFDIISDEINTKPASYALELMIHFFASSKKNRKKAIEAGAIPAIIELLPEASRSKTEKLVHLIELSCECAEGRLAFVEHGLGIAVMAQKVITGVFDLATKMAVRIMWLVCSCGPSKRVLDEMLVSGAVTKLVTLLSVKVGGGGGGGGRCGGRGGGGSSTKETVVRILKLHGDVWRRYPCAFSDNLGFIHGN